MIKNKLKSIIIIEELDGFLELANMCAKNKNYEHAQKMINMGIKCIERNDIFNKKELLEIMINVKKKVADEIYNSHRF